MKFFLTFFFLTFFIRTFAQPARLPIDSTTNLITYSETVTVNGNKDELYSRAREWFAKAYNSSAKVIQMDDKESGKIIGKALLQVHSLYGYFNYTISIYLKDGRYKYEIDNIYHTGQFVDGFRVPDYGTGEEMLHSTHQRKVFNKGLIEMDDNLKSLIVSLKEAMSKKAVIAKDDF